MYRRTLLRTLRGIFLTSRNSRSSASSRSTFSSSSLVAMNMDDRVPNITPHATVPMTSQRMTKIISPFVVGGMSPRAEEEMSPTPQ